MLSDGLMFLLMTLSPYQIVWDEKKGRWVNTAEDGDDEASAPPPPPKDSSFHSLAPVPSTPAFASPVPPSQQQQALTPNNNNEGNRFKLNKGQWRRWCGDPIETVC